MREKAFTRGRRRHCRGPRAAPHGRGGRRHAAHWRTSARRPLLDAFEGRRHAHGLLFHVARRPPGARSSARGAPSIRRRSASCPLFQSRDVTFPTFCQGPFEESARYRDFMGWEMPWYSAPRNSLEKILVGRRVGMMHIVCYLRQGSNVFETYWTTRRGVEAMDNSYRLLDLTVYGRQESVGGLARRLAATAERPAQLPHRWTSHRPVAPPEGRVFRRPGNRHALNRAPE